MIEFPVVTDSIGDLGYLYDRRSRPHPILKRTNSFVFTDDPVCRALAIKFDKGATGLRLRPFRLLRLERWGFDAMNGCVPYDAQTRAAAVQLNHTFVASLDYDDVPRHTAQTKSNGAAHGNAPQSTSSALRILGISPTAVLTPDIVMAAFKVQAKKYHPDNGGDPIQFRKLVEARDELIRLV